MRSNWRESRRLRSRRLFCNARKPEICWVVYQEYATTAASVTISPRKSPAVGDRTVERCTPPDYNVSMERRAVRVGADASSAQPSEARLQELSPTSGVGIG